MIVIPIIPLFYHNPNLISSSPLILSPDSFLYSPFHSHSLKFNRKKLFLNSPKKESTKRIEKEEKLKLFKTSSELCGFMLQMLQKKLSSKWTDAWRGQQHHHHTPHHCSALAGGKIRHLKYSFHMLKNAKKENWKLNSRRSTMVEDYASFSLSHSDDSVVKKEREFYGFALNIVKRKVVRNIMDIYYWKWKVIKELS